MEAPIYPAADHFIAPTRIARTLSTADTAIADLQAIPAAWAIVVKEVPAVTMLVNTPMLKPHLGNFSLRNLVQFGAVKSDGLDRADAELRALGPVA